MYSVLRLFRRATQERQPLISFQHQRKKTLLAELFIIFQLQCADHADKQQAGDQHNWQDIPGHLFADIP